ALRMGPRARAPRAGRGAAGSRSARRHAPRVGGNQNFPEPQGPDDVADHVDVPRFLARRAAPEPTAPLGAATAGRVLAGRRCRAPRAAGLACATAPPCCDTTA